MKHYRVKKDTFLWKAGAILHEKASDRGSNRAGYVAIEDIWDAMPTINEEYISSRIIEHVNNAEFFERVYPDSIKGKLFYTKDQLAQLYTTAFK